MITAGKPQYAYFMDRDQMTTDNQHFNSGGTSDNIVQTMPLGGGSFSTPAYYNELIYYIGNRDAIRAYIVSNGTLIADQPGTFGSRIFPFPGATPSISANGATNGIAWAIQYSNSTPAVLVAWNATNLSTEIYNSTQAGTRDQLTNGVKFSVPTVANGKVYVGSRYALFVYGLLAGGLQFDSATYTAPPGAGTVSLSVDRVGGSTGAVQVDYATSDGTAIAGQDYVSASGTLSWAAGDTSPKTFNVTLLNNPTANGSNTFSVTLSNAVGGAYLGAQSTSTVTVVTVASPYSIWKSTHFGTNASNSAIAGDNADPDGDGIPNILEYAFGTDPNSPDPKTSLGGTIVSNHFQLQFNRNTSATDLTYTAVMGPILTGPWSNLMTFTGGNWITNLPGATVTESDPTGSPPDQHVQVIITDPTDASSTNAPDGFYRLQVHP